jgi:putative membrane protein
MQVMYIKALHIIFVVTWFAGLFYMPRLFIYNTEAQEMEDRERKILNKQFGIMLRRLWYGITWPSAIITLIMGVWVLFSGGFYQIVFSPEGRWLLTKLCFVLLLYCYHYSLHFIFLQQMRGLFRFSSNQLRIWNEVATIFLFAIVMLVVVKQVMSAVWGLIGLFSLIVVLMVAIRIYKKFRVTK